MQCFFTSWNSPKCHSRKNLNCQVHQDMKLNAEQYDNLDDFYAQEERAVVRLVINLKLPWEVSDKVL